jgi:DNA-binding transcriptional MerR regulator
MQQLTIGKLAEETGITADTLRYYEKMKLLKAESRSRAGYRLYNPDSIAVVQFIRGAKALNFTLEEIRQLLAINTSDRATCAEMVKHTEGKIAEAETKIKELKEIKRVLTDLVKRCPGDATPIKACPIIDHIRKAKIALVGVLIAGILFDGSQAEAKPISYVDGVMVMQENDETGYTFSVDYTLSPKYAVGLYAKKEHEGDEFTTFGPQLNTLIKRWNFPGAQGNIFNLTGVGVSRLDGKNEPSAWTSFLADYETRRIFTSYEARFMYAGDIEKSVWQRARVGFAPYVANYEDLNTWFMVQVDHHPAKDDTLVVTPLVRFFYKTTLVEAGYSSNDHVMFNWVLQF